MKVVCIDNFNRDTKADKLIAENLSKKAAQKMADQLNSKRQGEDDPNWYVVREDDYKLWRGMEEFI